MKKLTNLQKLAFYVWQNGKLVKYKTPVNSVVEVIAVPYRSLKNVVGIHSYRVVALNAIIKTHRAYKFYREDGIMWFGFQRAFLERYLKVLKERGIIES